jgi:regulatory protein
VVLFHGFFYFWILSKPVEKILETITEIKLQKRDNNRLNVFIDGDYSFSVAMALSARLKVGQRLTSVEIENLQTLDLVEKAKSNVFRYLSYRPRSISESRIYLRTKGFDEIVIDQVVDRLVELEYLDDEAFTNFWIEQRQLHNPRSRYALRQELYQKGVSQDVIDAAVNEVDERDAAFRAAEKKARTWFSLSEERFSHKIRGFLQRRGFSYAITTEVTEKIWRSIVDSREP